MHDPNLGRVLKSYQLQRLIGEGGLGVVYLAEHTELGKKVAVKLLKPEPARSQEIRTRFLQEAQLCAQIDQDNIVQVLDFGETPAGECFLVMELLAGRSLAEALARHPGPVPVAQVYHLGLQLCAGLAAAHLRGAVHRDLKPENVFLTERNGQKDFVKILDFGLARVGQGPARGLTTVGKVLGTPYYMAPEQALGDPVDGRADLYALGIILYQLTTGTLPFDGAKAGEVMFKQVNEPPPPLLSRNPALPPALVSIIERCLVKDRDKRYASALVLAQALSAASGASVGRYFSGRLASLLGPSTAGAGLSANSVPSASSTARLPRAARRSLAWPMIVTFVAVFAVTLALCFILLR